MYNIPKTVPHEVAAALLLLSREYLAEADDAEADAVLRRLADGEQLVDLAYAKLSLPFVAKHLARIKPPWFSMDLVQERLQAMTLQSLRVAGAQVNFHRTCIAPLKIRHAYIKGSALGSQYYSSVGVRFARDVDVIVDPGQIREVIAAAQMSGYRLIDDARSQKALTKAQDIDAALRYERVANLLSPEGVLIEVHEEIDKDQGIFNETKMIWESMPVTVQSVKMNTLPHALHFVYVAYHSARHCWSALHWLADLDAIYRHDSFDEEEVFRVADTMGVGPLVEATILFIERSKRLPAELSASDRIDSMLELCVLNLEGGSKIEGKIRAKHTRYALPFEWFVTPAQKRKVLFYRFRGRFRPSYKAYVSLPLPPYLSWVYLITGPIQKLASKVRR